MKDRKQEVMSDLKIGDFIDDLCGIDPEYKSDITSLELKYNCHICCSIEKHNVLQLTYYYEVDFDEEEIFYVEIESGINNGTRLNNYEWGVSTKSITKKFEVLKDIVLDECFYKESSFLKRKAEAVLGANKSKLFEFHRKDAYDNYVTGGNSKMELDPLLRKLHLKYIFEEIDVYRNFI